MEDMAKRWVVRFKTADGMIHPKWVSRNKPLLGRHEVEEWGKCIADFRDDLEFWHAEPAKETP